jgi:YbbR domain-containing protein
MSSSFKNPFISSKLKAFFVFLFLASIFWVLTKFSKQDVASVVATITYVQVPEGMMLTKNNPQEISFNLAATRFEFLGYVLKKPKITIDVTSYFNEKNSQARVGGTALEKLILTQVVSDGRITQLSIPEINIELEQLNFKKVPVVPKVSIAYVIGFDALGAMRVQPDSVTITGAKQVLDTLHFIKTVPLELNYISETISQDLPLQKWSDIALTMTPNTVVISQDVVEYSQKIVSVPITMINDPLQGSFKLLPATVRVAFNVPVDRFNDITANDFKIICDYRARNQEDNFMIPIIKERPDDITGVEMETKKIDLLLFK